VDEGLSGILLNVHVNGGVHAQLQDEVQTIVFKHLLEKHVVV
jgi:hypothetical protein